MILHIVSIVIGFCQFNCKKCIFKNQLFRNQFLSFFLSGKPKKVNIIHVADIDDDGGVQWIDMMEDESFFLENETNNTIEKGECSGVVQKKKGLNQCVDKCKETNDIIEKGECSGMVQKIKVSNQCVDKPKATKNRTMQKLNSACDSDMLLMNKQLEIANLKLKYMEQKRQEQHFEHLERMEIFALKKHYLKEKQLNNF